MGAMSSEFFWHNGRVHRARAQDEPLQKCQLTGSACNAWLAAMPRSVMQHLYGAGRDCSRKQRSASTFEVEFCIAKKELRKAESFADLVAIEQSKRQIVWRTFVIAQPARIHRSHSKPLSPSL
jgi:hypothetical protein